MKVTYEALKKDEQVRAYIQAGNDARVKIRLAGSP